MHHGTRISETQTKIKKLKTVFVLVSFYFVVESIAGYYTGSLALLADAGHMLTDTFGIGLALFAAVYSKRTATPKHTYGFYRTEILASLVNGLIVLLISCLIFYEGYRRLFSPPEIQSISMLFVGVVGLVVNIVGILIIKDIHIHHESSNNVSEKNHHIIDVKSESKIQDGGAEDLNIQGAKLELLSDTIGSAAIIAVGIITALTNFWLADPIISLGLAFFIIPRAWSLLKRSVLILMEGTPPNLPFEEIKKAIMQVKGVTGLFDLHIWSITSGMYALSAHVVIIDLTRSNKILQEINSILEKRFGITHTTIQIETYHDDKET